MTYTGDEREKRLQEIYGYYFALSNYRVAHGWIQDSGETIDGSVVEQFKTWVTDPSDLTGGMNYFLSQLANKSPHAVSYGYKIRHELEVGERSAEPNDGIMAIGVPGHANPFVPTYANHGDFLVAHGHKAIETVNGNMVLGDNNCYYTQMPAEYSIGQEGDYYADYGWTVYTPTQSVPYNHVIAPNGLAYFANREANDGSEYLATHPDAKIEVDFSPNTPIQEKYKISRYLPTGEEIKQPISVKDIPATRVYEVFSEMPISEETVHNRGLRAIVDLVTDKVNKVAPGHDMSSGSVTIGKGPFSITADLIKDNTHGDRYVGGKVSVSPNKGISVAVSAGVSDFANRKVVGSHKRVRENMEGPSFSAGQGVLGVEMGGSAFPGSATTIDTTASVGNSLPAEYGGSFSVGYTKRIPTEREDYERDKAEGKTVANGGLDGLE